MSKGFEQTFLQRRYTNGGKGTWKTYSLSLLIRETQVKTTIRDHYTSIRMVKIKTTANNNCWQGCGEIETHFAERNVKWYIHIGKQFGSTSKCEI